MKKSTKVVQVLLGLLLILLALNAFLQFMPMPQPSPEMAALFSAISTTGYLFKFIAVIEIGSGILLIINKAVPLALAMLTPVILNALAAHLFLNDIGGIGAAVVVAVLLGYLIYEYRERFYPLLARQKA